MGGEFPIRDLGDLRFFLGIQVSRIEGGLHLSRSQYLANLLQSAKMTNLKPAVTPMLPSLDLRPQSNPLPNPHEYHRIIGSLQYITLTCPDVQLVMNKLSQFMASLEETHWMSMKRVLRFLPGTATYGVMIHKMVGRGITAYCDADWGGDTIDQKSQT